MGAHSVRFETIPGRSLAVAGVAEQHNVVPAGAGWPSRGWLLAALLLTAALALPFFLVDVPPVLDYPNHLARYVVLAHPDDPILSQMYAPQWRVLPNIGMDIIGAMLLKVTSVHVGGRMLLALSLFAPVLGVIVYHRVAFGRFAYWPLASGLVAYNGIFILGFMNFLLSLGLAFAGAACWMAQRRRGHQWRAVAVGAVAVAAIFLSHLFGVILFAILIGAQEAVGWLTARKSGDINAVAVLKTVGLLAAALCPAVILYLAGPLSDSVAAPGAWLGDRKFWTILTPFMIGTIEPTLWTAFAVLGLVIMGWRGALLASGTALAMSVLMLLFIAAPTAIKGGSFVDVRMPLMMGLLLFAGMTPAFAGRQAAVAGVVVAALIAVRTEVIAESWIGHRHDLAHLRAAIAPLQPLSRVLVARRTEGKDLHPDLPSRLLPGMYRLDGHTAALVAIERHAFWPLMFADPTQQPLQVRQPYGRLAKPLAEPVEWSLLNRDPLPEEFLRETRYLADWRSGFDYVLLIDPPAAPIVPRGLTAVVSTPSAILYKVDSPPL